MAPHASSPFYPVVRRIAAGLRGACSVTEGARLLVAVSGGADSVALLRALHALAPRRAWKLGLWVAHVQHHLREDAEADAAFVADLAASLNLPSLRRDIAPGAAGGNVEAAARRLRYGALQEMARDVSADAIATAHHADDQLETLLMRLLRGTTVTGLRGIAWRRAGPVPVIRPMLAATAAETRAYLRALNQPWREDATNGDASRWRARLRGDVLPVLRELRADAAHKAGALADHAREVWRVLEDAAERAAGEHVREGTLARCAARQLPPPVLEGVLRRMVLEADAASNLTAPRLRSIVRALLDHRNERREWLVGGACITLDSRTLRMTTRSALDATPRKKAPRPRDA